MKVIVTGGAGYIGAHVARGLAAAGHTPIIVDDLRCATRERASADFALEPVALRGHAGAGRRLRVATGPTPSSTWPAPSASASRCATRTCTGTTISAPAPACCSPAPAIRCGRFSSRRPRRSTATPRCRRSRSSVPLAPTSPYGASKLAFERLLHGSAPALGMRSAALRYFNAAGATPTGASARRTTPRSTSSRASSTRCSPARPVQVYGDDYPTPDGTCVRDYIHVADLADAHVRVLEATAWRAASASTSAPATAPRFCQVIETVGRRAGPHAGDRHHPAPPRRSRQPGRRSARAARGARLGGGALEPRGDRRLGGRLGTTPPRRALNAGPPRQKRTIDMSDASYVVQKVEWFQFRDPDGHAFFVMVSSLPNGFFTAVPVDLHMTRIDHAKMGLAATADEALAAAAEGARGEEARRAVPAGDGRSERLQRGDAEARGRRVQNEARSVGPVRHSDRSRHCARHCVLRASALRVGIRSFSDGPPSWPAVRLAAAVLLSALLHALWNSFVKVGSDRLVSVAVIVLTGGVLSAPLALRRAAARRRRVAASSLRLGDDAPRRTTTA